MRKLEFYTDGAFSSKTTMGGWACICLEDGYIIDEHSGYEPYSTGNRMEIMAFQVALNLINTIETGHTEATIYTDSAYVANTFNQGWYHNWLKNGGKTADRQDIKNQDLWKPTIASYLKLKNRFNIQIVKVEGHKDNKGNLYVDRLAVKARKVLEED